jgi:uncharacterized protein (TIGR03032 family)
MADLTISPTFLVGPPRAGLRLVANVLAQAPEVFYRDEQAPDTVEMVAELHPSNRQWESGRLAAADVGTEVVDKLSSILVRGARDRDDVAAPASGAFSLLDTSALHALRVPFLAAAFPTARFVAVLRDAGPSIASLAAAWRSQRFIVYPRLPEWPAGLPRWSYPLVEGWRDLHERAVHEIAAIQWQRTADTLLNDLEALAPERWAVVSYDALIRNPQAEAERLTGWLGWTWDRPVAAPLPMTATTLTPPDPGKWRQRDEITRVLPSVGPTAERVSDVLPRFTSGAVQMPTAEPLADELGGPGEAALPEAGFGSDFTASMPDLLSQINGSLLISTYQSGRVILARAEEGGGLNTHLRHMQMPMGMAVTDELISIGTKHSVVTWRNHPQYAERLEPSGTHDGAFLPLFSHVTGDIRIHDLVWAGGELWAVSTRFSALVTFAADTSFTPRWQPPFITAVAPEDRCHLNGCTVVDGQVRYVTALAETDTPGGWRDHKASGGVMIDVPSGEIVTRGLSMPHSPRWYDGRLWVLESGKGEIGVVDLDSGAVTPVAALPGFTRGLAFAGPYALVGLSEVRESVFRGLPVAAQQARECGVWIVDTRTGETAGFLRFTGAVTEIFDVQLLVGYRWPELVDLGTPISDDAFVIA